MILEVTDREKEHGRRELILTVKSREGKREKHNEHEYIPYIRQELARAHVSGGFLLEINQIGIQYNWHYVKLESFHGQIL
jgi:hypothetical protein